MANLNLNKVILGGRITHDIELKKSQSGMSIVSFSIAVQRKNDKNATDFINCKSFGKTGEHISKYFRKGSTICVIGNIQVSNWQDKDGNKRYSTDVIVDEALFVDSKNEVGSVAHDFASEMPKFEELADNTDLPF